MHIYLTIPPEQLKGIVESAEANGYEAVLVTCDHPTDRVRDDVLPLFEEASRTSDRQLTSAMPMPNLKAKDIVQKQNFSSAQLLTWKQIGYIQSLTRLPIICKGILARQDVQAALDHRVQGIVVRSPLPPALPPRPLDPSNEFLLQ